MGLLFTTNSIYNYTNSIIQTSYINETQNSHRSVSQIETMIPQSEPVVISKLHQSMVWSCLKGSRHIELMKFRMIRNIEKEMSSSKSISEFVKCKPVDCDIVDFFKVFGELDRYIYDKGRRPRGVDRNHIRVMYEKQFRQYFNCEIPTKVIAKQDVICKLSFPLVIMYNDIECQARVDIKYRVYSVTTGHEIEIRKIKSSQDASLPVIKDLKALTDAPKDNRTAIQVETVIFNESVDDFDWGILE